MSGYTPIGLGFISTRNSSTETLAGDEVFTGVGEDVSSYASVSIFYKSDVAAATSGLSIQFSTDNINWDVQLVGDLGAKTFQIHSLIPAVKFFRIVYTNGSAAQSLFRLQCTFHTSRPPTLISRGGQPLATTDATPTRPTTEIDLDFARKHIPGGRAFFFFGFNDDVGGSYEDIWAGGGDIQWQTAAAKVKVASTDAADKGTVTVGLGVHSVEIHGLSATGVDQDEIIVLDGIAGSGNEVESSLTYIRINKMHNEVVGTYGGSHEGNVECRVSNATFANGALLSVMKGVEGSAGDNPQYGRGEAGNGFWTVPLGKVMYITRLGVGVRTQGSGTISISLYEREDILDVTTPYSPRRVLWEVAEINSPHTKDFKSHIKIKALADIWFRALSSTGNPKIEVSLDFYLLDEDASGA